MSSPPSRRVLLLVERFAVVALLGAAVACGRSGRETVRAIPSPPSAPVAPSPAVAEALPPAPKDPIEILLEESNEHFTTGQTELAEGHVTAAKEHFDKALNLLIESPYGGRTEPRIREQFDRLVDRISTYEIRALAQGDGFTEREALEPASIDELLAVSASLIPADDDAVRATRIEPTSDADFPIPRNARVDSFITLFQGRLHEFLEEGMRRGSQYLPMIQRVFRAEGLPLDLAYVPLVESAFKTSALSRARARGVWQFMRGTGLENGLKQDWYVDERADAEKATVAAAKYLNSLAKAFNGDWLLALASYNGGPGRLERAIKRTKKTDFWELAAARRGVLPRETRDYVPMIMAAIIIARNPVQYGFSFDIQPPPDYEMVELPRAVDLRRIAEWTDSTVDVIQTLNPELRRWTTPVNDNSYALRVPPGTAAIVKARIEEAASDELATLNWHVVKKGETLATVARKLRVSRTDLAEANYLKTTARIAAGQKLIVPRETTVLMAARTDRTVPVADSRPLARDTVVAAVNPPEPVKISYRIKRGDTLNSIARLFETSVASIQSWNKLSGTRIVAGQRLTIYTTRAN